MYGLKTYLAVACVVVVALPTPSKAAQTTDLFHLFASCAGRLSAQMQHQWLMSDPGADQTEAERATMIGLLDATMPAGAGVRVRAERIVARQAHSALLTRATFNDDPRDAAWARRRADAEISQCRGLILR